MAILHTFCRKKKGIESFCYNIAENHFYTKFGKKIIILN